MTRAERLRRWSRPAAAALVLLAASGLALAQEDSPPWEEGVGARTVVVTGRASVPALPDTARIVLGVESQAGSARQAHEANARKVERIVAALQALGIPGRDIQTAGISLTPVYASDGGDAPRLVGYRAAYTLRVRVQPVQQAGAAADAAVQAGANRIESIEFTVEDPAPLQDEALRQAVADALSQARALAQAAGAELGEVLAIRDVSFTAPQPPVRLPLVRLAQSAEATPVLPGELSFQASATLVLALR